MGEVPENRGRGRGRLWTPHRRKTVEPPWNPEATPPLLHECLSGLFSQRRLKATKFFFDFREKELAGFKGRIFQADLFFPAIRHCFHYISNPVLSTSDPAGVGSGSKDECIDATSSAADDGKIATAKHTASLKRMIKIEINEIGAKSKYEQRHFEAESRARDTVSNYCCAVILQQICEAASRARATPLQN